MLKNKVIVVIGFGLIGKEIVNALIKNEATVVVADNDPYCDQDMVYNTDITSKESLNNLIDFVTNNYNQIDCVINCAYPKNKNYGKKFSDIEYHDFCQNINIHLGGYFLVCQTFSDYFIKKGSGNIINISSIYGCIPPKLELYQDTDFTMPFEYALIKTSINRMTEYLTNYFKENKYNIRINCICPGGIYDDQDSKFVSKYNQKCSSKGMLLPSDICGTITFMVSDSSYYIRGQNIIIDDGFVLS